MLDFKKYLPTWSFFVMILCFLLPFFLVKCQEQTLLSVKWINLIWIWEPTNNLKWQKNIEVSEKKEVYKTIIILILIIILLFWFSVKNLIDYENWKPFHYASDKIYFIWNLVIIFLLLFFMYDVKTNLLKDLNNKEKNSDEMWKQMSEQLKNNIKIEMWSWFIFIFLISILNILFFANELKYFEKIKSKIKETKEKNEKKEISEVKEEIKEKIDDKIDKKVD